MHKYGVTKYQNNVTQYQNKESGNIGLDTLTNQYDEVVVAAGAEIMKSFTASCTCNIDFAGGDDIIDGAALDAAAGTYLVKGSNGEANIVNTGAASTYAAETLALVGAADTIDVVVAGAAPATGRLRVYAVVVDVSAAQTEAAAAQRDLL